MRVILVASNYYPYIGGVEYVVKCMAERLAQRGNNVVVLCGDSEIASPREEWINNVHVFRWPIWSPKDAYHIPRSRSELGKFLLDLIKEADVIHVHSVHSVFSVYAGLLAAKSISNARFVVTPHYHGSGHTVLRKLAWILWRKNVLRLLRSVSVIHAVSNREKSLIVTHYPEVREKVVVIPNGVEEDVTSYKWQGDRSNYIVYAGRVEKYKRLELAMEIAREMNLKLLIIGEGPYRKKLEKYAEKQYRDTVEFLEPQPRDKYLELLSKARYAVNPSRHEAYGIFIAEALAIGVPSIVSREIAENLNAEIQPFNKQLVVASKAPIETWANIIQLYLEKLYGGIES
jgi:glycosyltransferase involved in cell wall biosynthesis